MNPLVKIASGLITSINRLIDAVDDRAADTIRQGFFFVMFLIAIGAIVLGYRMGSGSAKRTGIPLAETTNEVFEIDIKRQRDHARFNALLDSESVRETDRIDIEKNRFPTREGIDVESPDRIAEPDSMKKKAAPAFEVDTRSRIAEIDRTGDRPRQSDVRKLDRRESVLDKPRKPHVIDDRESSTDEPARDVRDIRDTPPVKKPDQEPQKLEQKKRPLIKMRPSASPRTSRDPSVIDR